MTPRARGRLHQAGVFATLFLLLVVTAGLVGLGAYWLIREDAWAFASSRADERVARVFGKMSVLPPPEASEAPVYFLLLDGRPAPVHTEPGEVLSFVMEQTEDPERIYVLYPAGGAEAVWWPYQPSAAIRDNGEGVFALRSMAQMVGADGARRRTVADYVGRERRWPDSNVRLMVFEKVEAVGPLHRRVALLTLSMMAALMLVSGVVVAVAQNRFWKRVQKLNDACEEIAVAGNLAKRVPASDGDALGLIGQKINRMLDDIEERGRLILTQDRFLDHDYREPITEIISSCNLLLAEAGSKDDPTTRGLRRMLSLAKSMDAGLTERLELYRFDRDTQLGDFSSRERLDLREIVEEAIDGNMASAEARNVKLVVQGDGNGMIEGARSLVLRALGNVIRNAVQHSDLGGQVDVRLPPGVDAVIEVRDRGRGMSADEIIRAMGPGLPARSSASGSGLGLQLVRGVMKAHKGELTMFNAQPGLVVRLKFLPAAALER